MRRRDDHHAIDRQLLDQGQVDIAGPRRQIDHQHIERLVLASPAHVLDHLAHGRGGHGSAPDHRRALIDDEADRHDLQAPGLEGRELAVLELRLLVDAQHSRRRGAIDIRIEQTGAKAERGEGAGEIDRDGGFAHPALAAGHGDHPADVLQPLGRRHGGGLGGGIGGDPGALADPHGAGRRRRLGGGEHDLGLFDPGHGRQRLFGGVAHGGVEGGVGAGDFQHETRPALGEAQTANQAGGDEAAAGLGIGDAVEGGQDLFAVGHR